MTTPEKTTSVATATPSAPALTKAEQWAKDGRCTICGKPVSKTHEEGEGDTCHEHIGKLRQNSTSAGTPPEGWVRMSQVCRKAEAAGISTHALVRAAGGDAATDPLLDPMFRVCYVGRGKWMDPRVLTEGFALIKKAALAPKVDKPVIKDPPKGPVKGPTSTADALKKAVKK